MAQNAYSDCDKCIQRGRLLRKMTFPDTNAQLRSELSFNEMEYIEHHNGPIFPILYAFSVS